MNRLRIPAPVAALAAVLSAVLAGAAGGGAPTPFAAADGVALAREAARAWAEDAALVYVENDEPIDARGAAERWGYVFFSPARDRVRGYSIRDGRIVVAEDLELELSAPPLAAEWIDSDEALAAAQDAVARTLRGGAPGALEHMVLMRGVFHDSQPDRTTWTLVYAVPGAPSLWVVVDAASGDVRRTWRG